MNIEKQTKELPSTEITDALSESAAFNANLESRHPFCGCSRFAVINQIESHDNRLRWRCRVAI
jgi:hypothetical protein